MMAPYIVCIDGNIGAGKSTLLAELKKKGYAVFEEDTTGNARHDWLWALDNAYADPKRWAFTLQIAVLKSMATQRDQMERMDEPIVFIERCPVSTMVFTNIWYEKGCLTPNELRLIEGIYELVKWEPDYTIVIDTPPDECYMRMNDRGRKCETDLPFSHIVSVDSEYSKLYSNNENLIKLPNSGKIADIVEDIINHVLFSVQVSSQQCAIRDTTA